MTLNAPPGRFTREGMAAVASPEAIAVVLILLLVAGGLLTISRGSGGEPAASPAAETGPPASVPSLAATSSGPTAVPTTQATSVPSSAPTIAPTAPPGSAVAWAVIARSLLSAEARVVERREELRDELSGDPKRSAELARLLRSTNSTLQIALPTIEALGATEAPDALVGRLREAHQVALDAGLAALTNSLQDVKAYRAGAAKVIAALTPLETLMKDLAFAAGEPDPLPDYPPSPAVSLGPSTAP